MLELKPERLGILEFTNQPISICGKSFVADMSGALFWPSQGALIVADLELGKRESAQVGSGAGNGSDATGRGKSDVGETLSRLASVIDHYNASSVIVLGDGIAGDVGETSGGMDKDNRKTLSIMQDHCAWLWVGERAGEKGRDNFPGGQRQRAFVAQGLQLRHRPSPGVASHEIAGAMAPSAMISRHGFEIARPCFVCDGLRIILPAFFTFAGGQNILGAAFEPMFGARGLSVFMLGHEGLYPIAPRLLRPD